MDGLKTDAPESVIWDIMRCWAKKDHEEQKRQQSAGADEPVVDAALEEGATADGEVVGAAKGEKEARKKKKAEDRNGVAAKILAKEPSIVADFTPLPDLTGVKVQQQKKKEEKSGDDGTIVLKWRRKRMGPKSYLPRFLPNPQPGWGPKTRAHHRRDAVPTTAEAERNGGAPAAKRARTEDAATAVDPKGKAPMMAKGQRSDDGQQQQR
jgi:hypothetical protein